MNIHFARPDFCDAVSPSLLDDESFVIAVHKRLRRHAEHSRLSTSEADDAVQRCTVRLVVDLAKLRRRHPSVNTLAAALWASGPADHLRAERVQRGQGAQLVGDVDTGRYASRTVVPLDTLEAEESLAVISEIQRHGIDEFERIDHLDLLADVLGSLPSLIRRLLWLVYVDGHTVTDAAELVRCSREHASRLLSQVRLQLEDLEAA
jgi:RNA polymerase sigma factor (sigma-70 family)